jgi:hypothetical protein
MSAVLLASVLALQQLSISPFPGVVGEPLTIRAKREAGAIANLPIRVEWSDGTSRDIGSTDSNGTLVFTPIHAGYHVVATEIDGVRNVAPVAIVPSRRRWWLALATVPFGLALLWSSLSRARGRRGP